MEADRLNMKTAQRFLIASTLIAFIQYVPKEQVEEHCLNLFCYGHIGIHLTAIINVKSKPLNLLSKSPVKAVILASTEDVS